MGAQLCFGGIASANRSSAPGLLTPQKSLGAKPLNCNGNGYASDHMSFPTHPHYHGQVWHISWDRTHKSALWRPNNISCRKLCSGCGGNNFGSQRRAFTQEELCNTYLVDVYHGICYAALIHLFDVIWCIAVELYCMRIALRRWTSIKSQGDKTCELQLHQHAA